MPSLGWGLWKVTRPVRPLQGQVQRGDVAKPGDDFGIPTDHLVVEPIEQPSDTRAATGGKDCGDFRIGESVHQLRCAQLIVASEVARVYDTNRRRP